MLELYHWEPNGSFLKPLIALHEKALAFRGHYVDLLGGEHLQAAIARPGRETGLNPEGEGPILVHEGRQVTESLFMIEYLEDAFPERPLRPAQPLAQARILAWARFINEVFMPAVNTVGCHVHLAPRLQSVHGALRSRIEHLAPGLLREGWHLALGDGYSEELLEDCRRRIALGVRRMEDALGAAQWLVGTAYSLADIDAFAIANSLPVLTPDLVNRQATPGLVQWLERIRSRPAVRAALAVSLTGTPEQAFVPGPEHARWG